ncbi:hypothetical protein J0H58_09570 [bacterium]|nr:hypothetical protein [bacterium]
MRRPLALLALTFAVASAAGDDAPDPKAVRAAVTFYASFDEVVGGDVGRGDLGPKSRYNHATEKGKFVHKTGYDATLMVVAKKKGIAGGALEVTDVQPRNGRMYFPAKGNLAYKAGGWGGSVSVWCKTDPDRVLKTPFCDPVQITQKGANNGGLWFDFNDAKPRDLRHGAFPAVPDGQKGVAESDPNAPLVRVPRVGWTADDWHHVALTWANLDTGRPDAVTALYIDGRRIGEVKGRALAMGWDIDQTGVYVAVGYIGLLDELALFDRPLTPAEVAALHRTPALLAPLKPKQ